MKQLTQHIKDEVIRGHVFRFVAKLILFLALLSFLDYTIGSILKTLYFKQKSGLNYNTTYSFLEMKEDVVIFGSSRAHRHYDPIVIGNKLNMTCYNAGRDAQSIYYYYAAHKSIIKRYTPKVYVLDINPGELYYNREYDYGKLEVLLPYYTSDEAIREIVSLRSRFERIKLLSKIYPYNSDLLTIIRYNNLSRDDTKGYVPMYGQIRKTKIDTVQTPDSRKLDPIKLYYFRALISEIIDDGITLIVVISPMYEYPVYEEPSLATTRQILVEYEIPILNYLKDSRFLDHPELFHDVLHLNKEGSELLSVILAEDLLTVINPLEEGEESARDQVRVDN